jgi:solute carrier family 41
VIAAILISSIAGLAFERFVRYFEGLGLILTVANGLCGNIASIHAARMATSLQLEAEIQNTSTEKQQQLQRYRSAKRTLFLLGAPIHMCFLLLLHVTGLGHTSITAFYSIGHMVAVNLHLVIILVWLTPNLVRFLWKRQLDPDTYTMPMLAAGSDLSGTLIFISMFSILWLLGDRDGNVGT